MEGAPRLRQHDNVQRQLTSFEKLLKRAISRFSLDKFVAHMRSIQKIMKDSQPEIKSLVQLHNILHGVTQEAKNTVNPIDSNVQLLRYFDAFYDDVDYLRKLKKYFDEKIYTCLYDYFYDPADDPVEPEVVSPHQTPRASGSDSGHVSEEADDEVSDTGMEAFHSLTPKGKLSQAVKDMYKLNQKWERILNTDLIDPRDYDSDSHYEVSKYTDLKWCDLIIRLVPDVFVKAYKSINLARIWWTQANKIYTTLPAKSKATTMYSNRVKNLEDTLCTLHNGIQQNEQQLKQKEHDLQELRDRESRVDVLSQSCERVEGMRLDMGQTYDDLVIQRDELCKSLAHHNLGADEHRKIKLKRDHLDSQLRKVSHELRVLAFHQQVLQEDFHLELTVRPDIIRFIGDVETKHDDIVEDMNEKKWKKRQAEKQLTLMRNNHEKMKEVKSKLLPSREPTIDSEVSNLSEGSTMDLIDNGRGNTFTVESARNKSKPRGTILPALPINEEPSDSSYSSTDIPDTSRTGSDDSGKSSRQPARAGHKIQPSRIPKLRTDQYGKRAEAPRY